MKRFARPYADVLLEAAAAEQIQGNLADQIEAFVRMLGENEDLRRLAENPAISPVEKEKIVTDIAEKSGWLELTKRALVLLAHNRRLAETGDVLAAYRELLDRSEGVALAEVVSAAELSPEQRRRLEAALEKTVGKKIRSTVTVDPTLIAGVVAKVGSTVYDASLRGEIRKVRRALTGAAEVR